MKQTKSFKNFFCCSCIAILSFTCISGCSSRAIDRVFMSETERIEDSIENPFFWEDSMPLEPYSNLYELTPFSFNGKPYNQIKSFGNNILVIGEGYYTNVLDTIEDVDDKIHHSNEGNDGYEDEEFADEDYGNDDYGWDEESEPYKINHYFSVYDPWNNKIVASLEPNDAKCFMYQVVGNHLFLSNEEDNTLNIYDETLKLIQTYPLDQLSITCSNFFYGSANSNIAYTYDADGKLFFLDFTKKELQLKPIDLPYSQLNVYDISPDGKQLLFSGVENNSLKYVVGSLNLSDFSVDICQEAYSFYLGDIGNNEILAQTDYENNIWENHFNGVSSYFTLPNSGSTVAALSNGDFVVQSYSSLENSKECISSFKRYHNDGSLVSSFDFSLGTNGSSSQQYITPEGVYLEESNCMFLLLYDSYCKPSFLIWDMNEPGTDQTALSVYEKESDISSAPSGPELNVSDWEDLSEVRAQADLLEQKYQVSIFLGAQIPDSIDIFQLKQDLDSDSIQSSLEELDQVMSIYPPGFWNQLSFGYIKGIKFFLSGSITSTDEAYLQEAGGFVNSVDNYLIVVLDTNYSYNWDSIVHHETAHMIDKRLDFNSMINENALFSEAAWSSFNPDDFEYLNTYYDFANNPAYEKYPNYFVDYYGTTFATEDRAELFADAIWEQEQNSYDPTVLSKDSPRWNKLKFYCECIRDGFDTTDWPSVLPWEEFMQE